MISKISEQIFIPLTVGGGVSTKNHVRELLNSGADKISINSSAVNNPNLIFEFLFQNIFYDLKIYLFYQVKFLFPLIFAYHHE